MSEVLDNGTIVMTPEDGGIEVFAFLQAYHRLKLEYEGGLVFRQPTLAAVKRAYGIKAGTKRKALEEMLEMKRKLECGEMTWQDLQRLRQG